MKARLCLGQLERHDPTNAVLAIIGEITGCYIRRHGALRYASSLKIAKLLGVDLIWHKAVVTILAFLLADFG